MVYLKIYLIQLHPINKQIEFIGYIPFYLFKFAHRNFIAKKHN